MIHPPSIEPLEARIAPAFSAVVELATLDGTTGFTIRGENAGDGAGYSVSGVEDVDGDGFADFVVSAIGADPNGDDSGACYLIWGTAAGFPANLDLTTLDGISGIKIGGASAGSGLGGSVRGAGDVNADGFHEIVMSAHPTDSGPVAYLLNGKSVIRAQFQLYGDISNADGVTAFYDQYAYSYAETVVDSAGDINGDGFADTIVVTPRGYSYAFSDAVHVVYGSADGLGAAVDLATLNGTSGFTIQGENPGDSSGASVSRLGDVNGDGIDDFAIGFPHASPNGKNSGKAYVIFGRTGGFPTGVDLANLDGTNGFAVLGATAYDVLGTSVGSADVNGDGFADAIISAPGASTPTVSRGGATYVIYGGNTGFPAALNVADLNGTNGLTIHGAAALDQSGNSVSGAGDVNNDGFEDFIIGAAAADPNGNRSGAAFLVFGGPALGPTLELSSLNGSNGVKINGVSNADLAGFSVGAAGDVNADGFADLLVGATGVTVKGAPVGASYVVYGMEAAVLPTISIGDASITEGNKGPRGLDFNLTLSAPSVQPITVIYSTADDTATAESGDYTPQSDQTVTFQPGQTIQTIRIDALGDLAVELDETFFVNLSSATNATIADAQGQGTIVNDDGGGGGDGVQISGDGSTATFTDLDGDRVTVTTNRGQFTGEFLQPDQDGFNIYINVLDGLRGANRTGASFSGAKISVSAKKTGGGDGLVNVGYFDASGIGLKSLKIQGNLGAINVGEGVAGKTAIKSLKVNSIGPSLTSSPVQSSTIAGTVGVLKVSEDVTGVLKITGGGASGGPRTSAADVVKKIVIKGDLDGSAGGMEAGLLQVGGGIKRVVVKGSVIGGATHSGIVSDGELANVKIGGDLRSGDANIPVTISALGDESATSQKDAIAIKKLSIAGSVFNAEVLAGYDRDGIPFNSDAGIGSISVGRNWEASSVVAGVADVTGDGFGRNDGPIAGDTTPALLSRIASIVIKGTVEGSSASTADHFGIVAQEIGKVFAGAVRMSRIDGPVDLLLDEANDDFRAVGLG